jgi:hypothetical protein
LYGYRFRCRTNRACEHFAYVKILERFSRHETSLTALPRESSRVAGINLVVEGHCFMSFDGAKDQTLCAPAYLAVGKPDCQCCSFYIRTSRPAGRIDAASRSEKAMEIQAKRQGLLPLGFLLQDVQVRQFAPQTSPPGGRGCFTGFPMAFSFTPSLARRSRGPPHPTR